MNVIYIGEGKDVKPEGRYIGEVVKNSVLESQGLRRWSSVSTQTETVSFHITINFRIAGLTLEGT
jgi:hypothetical protein